MSMNESQKENQEKQGGALRRNLLVILGVLAVVVLLLAVTQKNRPAKVEEDAPKLPVMTTLVPTDAPTETAAPEENVSPEENDSPTENVFPTEDAMEATEQPEPTATVDLTTVDAFLIVTVGNTTYEPIPLTEDGYYGLSHDGCYNIIHVTENSVSMYESNCENQDCVEQGEVTLENKDTRILGNMIICLPNQVTLQLCNREELTEWISSMVQEEMANE